MDNSEKTCNLCEKRKVCSIKRSIWVTCDTASDILGKDYDDIFCEVASICDEFELED